MLRSSVRFRTSRGVIGSMPQATGALDSVRLAASQRIGTDMDGQGAAQVSVEINFPNGGVFGREEILLIDAIRTQRSIIGASRALGVSYRKCWLIVDALNRTFESTVIATYPGRRGSGAEITAFGERLVALYQSIERHAGTSAEKSLAEVTSSLDWNFDPKARSVAGARDLA
jgi:molybdate transport system regulatory protein